MIGKHQLGDVYATSFIGSGAGITGLNPATSIPATDPNHVLITDAAGLFSHEAHLSSSRGGTGADLSASTAGVERAITITDGIATIGRDFSKYTPTADAIVVRGDDLALHSAGAGFTCDGVGAPGDADREWLNVGYSGGQFTIAADSAGAGVQREIQIDAARVNVVCPMGSTLAAVDPEDFVRKAEFDAMSAGTAWQKPVDAIANAPDPGPVVGTRYIAGSAPTEPGWTADYIYEWTGAAWDEQIPAVGWACVVSGGLIHPGQSVTYNASHEWVLLGLSIDHLTLLNRGVNTHAQIDAHLGTTTTDPHAGQDLRATANVTHGSITLASVAPHVSLTAGGMTSREDFDGSSVTISRAGIESLRIDHAEQGIATQSVAPLNPAAPIILGAPSSSSTGSSASLELHGTISDNVARFVRGGQHADLSIDSGSGELTINASGASIRAPLGVGIAAGSAEITSMNVTDPQLALIGNGGSGATLEASTTALDIVVSPGGAPIRTAAATYLNVMNTVSPPAGAAPGTVAAITTRGGVMADGRVHAGAVSCAGAPTALTDVMRLADIRARDAAVRSPLGFEDPAETSISFNTGTRLFTLAPTGATFSYYIDGVQTVVAAPMTVTIPNATGLYYILISGGVIIYQTSPAVDARLTNPFVATVCWRSSAPAGLVHMTDERHYIYSQPYLARAIRTSEGFIYRSGLEIGDLTYTMPVTDDNARFSLTAGSLINEDAEIAITEKITDDTIRVYARNADGSWTYYTSQGAFYSIAGVAQYNPPAGGVAPVTNNYFVLGHVIASNSTTNSCVAMLGRAVYASVSLARNMIGAEVLDLQRNITTLPFPAFRAITTIIYQYSSSYTGSSTRVRIAEVSDWRSTRVLSHSALADLNADDHMQYVTVAGRLGEAITLRNAVEPPQSASISCNGSGDFALSAHAGRRFVFSANEAIFGGNVTINGSTTTTRDLNIDDGSLYITDSGGDSTIIARSPIGTVISSSTGTHPLSIAGSISSVSVAGNLFAESTLFMQSTAQCRGTFTLRDNAGGVTTSIFNHSGGNTLLQHSMGGAQFAIDARIIAQSSAVTSSAVTGAIVATGGIASGGRMWATNMTCTAAPVASTDVLRLADVSGAIFAGTTPQFARVGVGIPADATIPLVVRSASGVSQIAISTPTVTSNIRADTGGMYVWPSTGSVFVGSNGATHYRVSIPSVEPSTSAITGALTIGGGLGVAAALNVGGMIKTPIAPTEATAVVRLEDLSNGVLSFSTPRFARIGVGIDPHVTIPIQSYTAPGANPQLILTNGADTIAFRAAASAGILCSGTLNLNSDGGVSRAVAVPCTTAAASKTSAAFTIVGGIGASARSYLGELHSDSLYVHNEGTPAMKSAFTVSATGMLTIMPDGGEINMPKVLISDSTPSISVDTGALIIAGGIGASQSSCLSALQVTSLDDLGTARIRAPNPATSETTGAALIVDGGIAAGAASTLNGIASDYAIIGASNYLATLESNDRGISIFTGSNAITGSVFIAPMRHSTVATTYSGNVHNARGTQVGSGVINGWYTPTTAIDNKMQWIIGTDIDSALVGTIRIRWVPTYDNAPTTTHTLISIATTVTGFNEIAIYHEQNTGNLYMRVTTSDGSTHAPNLSGNGLIGAFYALSGTEFVFELNYSIAAGGVSRLFINGALNGFTTSSATPSINARTMLTIANSIATPAIPYGKYRDVVLWRTTQHSSGGFPYDYTVSGALEIRGDTLTDGLRVSHEFNESVVSRITTNAAGILNVDTPVEITDTTAAVSKTTGALISRGGIAAMGRSYLPDVVMDRALLLVPGAFGETRIFSNGTDHKAYVETIPRYTSMMAGAVFVAMFRYNMNSDINAAGVEYAGLYDGAGTPIVDGAASFLLGTGSYAAYSVPTGVDPGLLGTARFMWKPARTSYGNIDLFEFGTSAGGALNVLTLRMISVNRFIIRRGNSLGTYTDTIFQAIGGGDFSFSHSTTQEYEIEFCWDLNSSGTSYLFIDGTLVATRVNEADLPTIGPRNYLTIGNNFPHVRTLDVGYIRNFALFPGQFHTTDYVAELEYLTPATLLCQCPIVSEGIELSNPRLSATANLRVETVGELECDVPISGQPPTAPSHLVTKAYADGIVTSLLPMTYSSGILEIEPTSHTITTRPLISENALVGKSLAARADDTDSLAILRKDSDNIALFSSNARLYSDSLFEISLHKDSTASYNADVSCLCGIERGSGVFRDNQYTPAVSGADGGMYWPVATANDPGARGTVRIHWTATYNGSPATTNVFCGFDGAAHAGHISMQHLSSGHIQIVYSNNAGAIVYVAALGTWSPVIGTTYELEYNFSGVNGETNYCFVDGTATGSHLCNVTFTMAPHTSFYIASEPIESRPVYGAYDSVIYWNVQKHTSDYGPGYHFESAIAFEGAVSADEFRVVCSTNDAITAALSATEDGVLSIDRPVRVTDSGICAPTICAAAGERGGIFSSSTVSTGYTIPGALLIIPCHNSPHPTASVCQSTMMGILLEDAAISGGALVFPGADAVAGKMALSIPISQACDPGDVGCVQFKWRAGYTGVNPSAQNFVFYSLFDTLLENEVTLFHTAGAATLTFRATAQSISYVVSAAFSPTIGQTYTISTEWNATILRVLIDGQELCSDTHAASPSRGAMTGLYIGNDSSAVLRNTYGAFSDIIVYDDYSYSSTEFPNYSTGGKFDISDRAVADEIVIADDYRANAVTILAESVSTPDLIFSASLADPGTARVHIAGTDKRAIEPTLSAGAWFSRGRFCLPTYVIGGYAQYELPSVYTTLNQGCVRIRWWSADVASVSPFNVWLFSIHNTLGRSRIAGYISSTGLVSMQIVDSANVTQVLAHTITTPLVITDDTEYDIEMNWNLSIATPELRAFVNGVAYMDATIAAPVAMDAPTRVMIGNSYNPSSRYTGGAFSAFELLNVVQHITGFTTPEPCATRAVIRSDLAIEGTAQCKQLSVMPLDGSAPAMLSFADADTLTINKSLAADSFECMNALITNPCSVTYDADSNWHLVLTYTALTPLCYHRFNIMARSGDYYVVGIKFTPGVAAEFTTIVESTVTASSRVQLWGTTDNYALYVLTSYPTQIWVEGSPVHEQFPMTSRGSGADPTGTTGSRLVDLPTAIDCNQKTKAGALALRSADVSSSKTTGALTVAGGLGVSGASNIAALTADGLVRATSTEASTSKTTGALTVAGGLGVSGTTHMAALNADGLVRATSTEASTSKTTGALTIAGGFGVSGATYAAAFNADGLVRATSTEASTSKTTGALTIAGGFGVSGATYAAALNADGLVRATSTEASTSKTTGALTIAGGFGVSGASYMAAVTSDNAIVNPTFGAYQVLGGNSQYRQLATYPGTSITVTRWQVYDTNAAFVEFAFRVNNSSSPTRFAHTRGFNNIAMQLWYNPVTYEVRLYMKNSYVSNITVRGSPPASIPSIYLPEDPVHSGTPTGLVDAGWTKVLDTITDISIYGVIAGTIELQQTTASVSKTTGALITAGGLGVSGDTYMAALNADGLVRATSTEASTSKVTGAVTVAGGLGVSGATNMAALTADGLIRATSTEASTSKVTGAFTVAGGLGVSGATYAAAINADSIACSGVVSCAAPTDDSHACNRAYITSTISGLYTEETVIVNVSGCVTDTVTCKFCVLFSHHVRMVIVGGGLIYGYNFTATSANYLVFALPASYQVMSVQGASCVIVDETTADTILSTMGIFNNISVGYTFTVGHSYQLFPSSIDWYI